MKGFKILQYHFPEHFLEEMDDYIKKVNEGKVHTMRYKRSILLSDAIRYYIKHDLASKIK